MSDELLNQNNNYIQIEKAIKYIDNNFKQQPSIDEIAKNIDCLFKLFFKK